MNNYCYYFLLSLCLIQFTSISIAQTDTCTQATYNSNCTKLQGGISFKNIGQFILNYSSLATVNGDITFYNNNNLTYINMENLRSLIGSLVIQNHGKLTDFNFNSLQSVSGELNINSNSAITSFDFPNLVSVQNDVRVTSISSLSSIFFPKLTSIGSNLIITQNPVLQRIQFCSLNNITKNLNISSTPAILCCESLQSVTSGAFIFPQCDNSSACSASGVNIFPKKLSLIANTGTFALTILNKPQEFGAFNISISKSNSLIVRPSVVPFTTDNYATTRNISVYVLCPANTATINKDESLIISLNSIQYCPIDIMVDVLAGTSCYSNVTSSTFKDGSSPKKDIKSSACMNNVNSIFVIILLLVYILNGFIL